MPPRHSLSLCHYVIVLAKCLYLCYPQPLNILQLHFTTVSCHINTAVFVETSVLGQGALVFQLRKGVFTIVHIVNVLYVPLELATV
jgi:hypothetical protein